MSYMKRVYVASSTKNVEQVRLVQEMFRARRVTITEDWTKYALALISEEGDTALEAAEGNKRGVRTADLVVALWHPEAFGTIHETGLASAYDIPLWLVGDWRPSVFWSMPHVDVLDWEAFCRRLGTTP